MATKLEVGGRRQKQSGGTPGEVEAEPSYLDALSARAYSDICVLVVHVGTNR